MTFAPSEEYTILCDVLECQASLSMVADVARSEHGWGRISVYGDQEHDIFGICYFDLCAEHYQAVMAVLR